MTRIWVFQRGMRRQGLDAGKAGMCFRISDEGGARLSHQVNDCDNCYTNSNKCGFRCGQHGSWPCLSLSAPGQRGGQIRRV